LKFIYFLKIKGNKRKKKEKKKNKMLCGLIRCMICFAFFVGVAAVVIGGVIIKKVQELDEDLQDKLSQLDDFVGLDMSEFESDPIKKYNVFKIPRKSIKISDYIYNLGKRNHPVSGEVETIAFITIGGKKYPKTIFRKGDKDFSESSDKKREILPSFPSENFSLPEYPPKCCSYMNGYPKWEEPQSFNLDPTNSLNLDIKMMREVINNSLLTWEFSLLCNSNSTLNKNETLYSNELVLGIVSSFAINEPNDVNDISFAYIEDVRILSVSIIYYIPIQNILVEGDIFINMNNNNIGDSVVDPSKFDLYTLILKSLGNFFGIRETSQSSNCKESVMYPVISPSEVKRTLIDDDISCINLLYSDFGNLKALQANSGAPEFSFISPVLLFILIIVIFWK